MRIVKLYLLSFALFGFLGAGVLVCLELLVRWSSLSASPEPRDHAEETWYLPARFRPNYRGKFWNISFQTNRYGFRDEPDFPTEKAQGEYRVLSLGDSIGFGLGIEAEQHYTKVAERLLQISRLSSRVSVINAGGQGYSPSGYHVYLKHEGLKLEPSMIVLEVEFLNDISDEALLVQERNGDSGLERVRGGRYLVSWDGQLLGTYARSGSFLEKTYLFTEIVRRYLNLLSMNRPEVNQEGDHQLYYSLGFDRVLLTPHRLELGWQNLFTALQATHRLLLDRDIPLLVMLMPSRYLYQELNGYSEAAARIFARGVREAHDADLPFVDFSEVIGAAGGEELFFDFAHLTAAGNSAVGKALAEELRLKISRQSSIASQDPQQKESEAP